jgi:HPt (histidine-containing phosphotransfer) domain-containing protein
LRLHTGDADDSSNGPAQGAWDWSAALEHVGHDESLLRELASLFCAECREMMEDIEEAVVRADGELVHQRAHKLKNSLAIFAASQATQIALELERMGSRGDLTRAEEACHALKVEVDRLLAALRDLDLQASR